eukprot:2587832-Pleurochrysis_carterae.AAC.1
MSILPEVLSALSACADCTARASLYQPSISASHTCHTIAPMARVAPTTAAPAKRPRKGTCGAGTKSR